VFFSKLKRDLNGELMFTRINVGGYEWEEKERAESIESGGHAKI
jgi:hypothetical protein